MFYKRIDCKSCGKSFKKEVRRYNEAVKFKWNFYCSLQCQYDAKTKQRELKCGNPSCNKLFKRMPNDILVSKTYFCSKSCSAIINNKNKIKWKTCTTCGNKFFGSNKKYCSIKCTCVIPPKPLTKVYNRQIIEELRNFYKENERIPYKKEYLHTKAARVRFGSWNKAIIAAGFKPNPVKFANKYMAKDGHKCDSMAEKIIDDWLFIRKIKHKTKIPYNYHRMTADFKIGDTYIEFFGLQGKISYDKLVKEKEALWREKNLKVIKIYPNDLFPKNKLNQIFAHILV